MADTCAAKTKQGRRCQAPPLAGSRFCAFHADPDRAAALGRKGGLKNRHYVGIDDVNIVPPSTPEDVKALLSQAMADVRSRKLDPKIASALTYIATVLLKAFDATDIHRRLFRLEAEREGREGKDEPRASSVTSDFNGSSDASLPSVE